MKLAEAVGSSCNISGKPQNSGLQSAAGSSSHESYRMMFRFRLLLILPISSHPFGQFSDIFRLRPASGTTQTAAHGRDESRFHGSLGLRTLVPGDCVICWAYISSLHSPKCAFFKTPKKNWRALVHLALRSTLLVIYVRLVLSFSPALVMFLDMFLFIHVQPMNCSSSDHLFRLYAAKNPLPPGIATI